MPAKRVEVTRVPELLNHVASPASAYLLLFGLLVVDAFVPVVPTQVIMITGGALTIYGGLNLLLTIGVGALGVFCGDVACYLLGRGGARRFGPRRTAPVDGGDRPAQRAGSRPRQAAGRFARALRQPGPMVILLCRFVPGGRMIACFNAGRVRYPYRRFLAYDALAALGWAGYGALVGHLGGAALTESVWRLATVALVAAAGFAAAGWALTRTGERTKPESATAELALAGLGSGPGGDRTEPTPTARIIPARATSADGPPR